MRFEGSLAAWNPERGFGAIAPRQSGLEVFVHISAFPRDGEPPQLGEPLSFEIASGRDGRKEAAQVLRSKRTAGPAPAGFMAPSRQRQRMAGAQRRRRLGLGGLLLALVVGAFGLVHLSQSKASLPNLHADAR
ncbi:cold-shock protein [Pelomonas sp. KK5]|uniref:cold-shock protein n=1 Tax=Pelomonas sp. KK5 TaxID=1855730 RepID=UPI00097BB361|nr:cold shock domain-containing protein [Pelomonas sp. KK5]